MHETNKNKKILILELNNKCNNACYFCDIDKSGYSDKDFVLSQIGHAGRRGYVSLDIRGSEPTLNRNLFGYIEKAKKSGFTDITVFSNGRMFCYYDYCRKIAEAGVNRVIFFLYTHDEKVFDETTMVRGSFMQLVEGIRNMRRTGMDCGGEVAINKKNIGAIHHTIDFFSRAGLSFFIVRPILKFPQTHEYRLDIETDSVLDMEDMLALRKNLNKINNAQVALHFIPPCIIPKGGPYEIKSNKGLSNAIVIHEDGRKSSVEKMVLGVVQRKKECISCREKNVCEGEPFNINISSKYLIIWAVSDLHACRKNGRAIIRIFRDVDNVVWSKAIFAGDIVEGDEGKTAYLYYKKLLSAFFDKRDVYHVAGNHEYVYDEAIAPLDIYRKLISRDLFYSRKIGNIVFIFLSLDAAPDSIKDYPCDTIKENTFTRLCNVLKGNPGRIKVVISHYPVEKIKVGKDKLSLADMVPEAIMPDVWIYGHLSADKEMRQTVRGHTVFINCSNAVHNMKSRFILFKNNSREVVIKERDHSLGKFTGQEIHVGIGRPFQNNIK